MKVSQTLTRNICPSGQPTGFSASFERGKENNSLSHFCTQGRKLSVKPITLAWEMTLVIHRWQMLNSEEIEESTKVPGPGILGERTSLGAEGRGKKENYRRKQLENIKWKFT